MQSRSPRHLFIMSPKSPRGTEGIQRPHPLCQAAVNTGSAVQMDLMCGCSFLILVPSDNTLDISTKVHKPQDLSLGSSRGPVSSLRSLANGSGLPQMGTLSTALPFPHHLNPACVLSRCLMVSCDWPGSAWPSYQPLLAAYFPSCPAARVGYVADQS